MLLFGMAMAMSGENFTHGETREPTRKPLTEKEKQDIEEKINRRKGLTKFHYQNEHVWALNQKSADKKAKKKGLL